MEKFYVSPGGDGFLSGFDVTVPVGWTEVTEAVFNSSLASAEAQNAADRAAAAAAENSDALARAQSVYDEIVGIHPISALETAKLIYPNFENEGTLQP